MRLISNHTWRVIKESFQTFLIAICVFCFAILLTFVEDFAIQTRRPAWMVKGIEVLSIVLFIGDGLVILSVCARIVLRAIRDFLDEFGKD